MAQPRSAEIHRRLTLSGSRAPQNKQAGSAKPARPAAAKAPPVNRRSRRLAERRDDRLRAAGTAPSQTPAWRSPLALMTFGALAVGVVLVALFATGVLSGHKATSLGLLQPVDTSPYNLADGRTLGKAGAPVTIDLWGDFQCSACGSFTRGVEPQLVTNLVDTGKARIAFHDYILIDTYVQNGHESLDAATAARCASDQGKFWQYHDWLYANQIGENVGSFVRSKLDDIAFTIGLNQGTFDSCFDAGTQRQAVSAESAQGAQLQFTDTSGKPQKGVNQTPTVIINGKEISPSYDAIAAAVSAAAGSGASPAASASGASTGPSPSGSTTP